VRGLLGGPWSHLVAPSLTEIPNSSSGLDAARLSDGRIVLACTPTRVGRSPLSLLTSEDNGETWPWRRELETEPGEYSHPSIIQAAGGRVHVVYTYRRLLIQHVTLEADDLENVQRRSDSVS
jgi:predicted neuraminidase